MNITERQILLYLQIHVEEITHQPIIFFWDYSVSTETLQEGKSCLLVCDGHCAS